MVNLRNRRFGRVCVCISLHRNTVHVCGGEETCREEKKGVGGDTVGAREVSKTISTRERLGTSNPKANNSSQHPDFTSFDSLHTEGLFTLAVFSPELKDCSGQGVWWPSSILLGGLDTRARQGHKYFSSNKLGSDSSPGSVLFIHYLA